jgi:urease accessory protein
MHPAEAIPLASWRAELALDFERRGPRTVLASRRHEGPLVVQKPLYPEGGEVCHAIVVHPPAGIAGGDALEIAVRAGPQARAQLTTPGAAKWYRSSGARASQRISISAAAGAALEWLPQESIVFDGALADLRTEIALEGDACFFGWEITCLGRTGSGERFVRGDCRFATELRRDRALLWRERGHIEAGGALMRSFAGLAGCPVFGTFCAAAPRLAARHLAACRAARPPEGEGAVTLLPGVLLGRFLGASAEAARAYFAELWRLLRPALAGREAQPPRIWST